MNGCFKFYLYILISVAILCTIDTYQRSWDGKLIKFIHINVALLCFLLLCCCVAFIFFTYVHIRQKKKTKCCSYLHMYLDRYIDIYLTKRGPHSSQPFPHCELYGFITSYKNGVYQLQARGPPPPRDLRYWMCIILYHEILYISKNKSFTFIDYSNIYILRFIVCIPIDLRMAFSNWKKS